MRHRKNFFHILIRCMLAFLFIYTAAACTVQSLPQHTAPAASALNRTDFPVQTTAEASPAQTPSSETPNPAHFLKISELMASNTSGITDRQGVRQDWIELTNYGSVPIHLKGFSLSLSPGSVKWTFPDVRIAPQASLLLFASGAGTYTGELHIAFKLSKESKTVLLADPEGLLIDSVTYPDLKDDYAYARIGTQPTDPFAVTNIVSPGYPNTVAGVEAYFAEAEAGGKMLVINEAVSSNFQQLEQNGAYYDWIEIKNVTAASVNLKNYYLSDSKKDPLKWNMPDQILAPGEICVFLASGDESLTGGSYVHTNFKLDGISECLYLSDAAKNLLDGVLLTDIPYGGSCGRMPGKAGFFYFEKATPGEENTAGKREISHTPVSLTPDGIYDKSAAPILVTLSGEGRIYYTLDGKEPTDKSLLYTGPFTISETTVVRAVSIAPDKIKSDVYTAGFFINEGHTLPILSVVLDPDDLWSDETGIYVKGPEASPEAPYYGANYYKDWERKASAAFYEKGGSGFTIDCGLKIAGGGSRYLEKKSFSLKFKSRYGSEFLEYPIFENPDAPARFKTLMIRCGEDYTRSIFRDEFLTALAADGMQNLEVQNYRFCVLYLNGAYWGIYAIREKVDEDFVVSRHPETNPETVSLIRSSADVEFGSGKAYDALCQYVKKHDMSLPESYRYLADRVNVDSMIEWLAAEVYSGNKDLANIRCFTAADPAGKQTLKWYWVFYDLDWGYIHHVAPFYFLQGSAEDSRSVLFRALLESEEGRDRFLTQLAYHLRNTFSEQKALQKIALLESLLEPELLRNCRRWDVPVENYRQSVAALKAYASSGREQEVIDAAVLYFKLSAAEQLHYFGMVSDERLRK